MSVARQVSREAVMRVPPLPSRDLQELWFATRRREWRTLVVMPASGGTSALPIAKALGEVGGFIRMSPVQVIQAEGMDLGKIASLVIDINSAATSAAWTMNAPMARAPGGWEPSVRLDATIVALDPVVSNPLVLPVALAADAVLLCVELGTTQLEAARRTIELVGRDRIIGSVVIKH
jgi:hypothetical protein